MLIGPYTGWLGTTGDSLTITAFDLKCVTRCKRSNDNSLGRLLRPETSLLDRANDSLLGHAAMLPYSALTTLVWTALQDQGQIRFSPRGRRSHK